MTVLVACGWFVYYINYFQQDKEGGFNFERDKDVLTPEQLAFKYGPVRQMAYFRQIDFALEEFYAQKGFYPKDLSELLPVIPAVGQIINDHYDGFLYAYSSEDNPQHYHFGIKLSEHMKELEYDSDFDSKKEDCINGFDGADPIFDNIN